MRFFASCRPGSNLSSCGVNPHDPGWAWSGDRRNFRHRPFPRHLCLIRAHRLLERSGRGFHVVMVFAVAPGRGNPDLRDHQARIAHCLPAPSDAVMVDVRFDARRVFNGPCRGSVAAPSWHDSRHRSWDFSRLSLFAAFDLAHGYPGAEHPVLQSIDTRSFSSRKIASFTPRHAGRFGTTCDLQPTIGCGWDVLVIKATAG